MGIKGGPTTQTRFCLSEYPPTTRRPTATTRRPPATSRRPPATPRRPTATTRRPSITTPRANNLKITKLIVQVGPDGTNDDVTIKVRIQDNYMTKFVLTLSYLDL